MKRENVNLILAIVAIFILIVIPIIHLFGIEATLDEGTSSMINEITEEEDEAGQLFKGLFLGTMAATTVIARIVATFVKLLLIVVCFLELLFTIIARNVIKNKAKKTTYRVLMTISYIPLTFILLSMISRVFKLFSPITLLCVIVSAICLGINYYNTYSKKMYLVEDGTGEDIKDNTNNEANLEGESSGEEEKKEGNEGKWNKKI